LPIDLSAFDEGEPDSVNYAFGVKKIMTEHEWLERFTLVASAISGTRDSGFGFSLLFRDDLST
jgi:hypothetical protein